MDLDDYAAYVEMNDRFHKLIMQGCGNVALQRVMDMLDGQPFASPSAMLPMQSSMEEGPPVDEAGPSHAPRDGAGDRARPGLARAGLGEARRRSRA